MNVKFNNTMLERRVKEAKRSKETLDGELRRGLLLLRYLGQCKCGLMLTEQDRSKKRNVYNCPHCGASGPLVGVA